MTKPHYKSCPPPPGPSNSLMGIKYQYKQVARTRNVQARMSLFRPMKEGDARPLWLRKAEASITFCAAQKERFD